MATRSMIGYIDGNRIVTSYCHYDGYPEDIKVGVGYHLENHYNSLKDAKSLVDMGSRDCLTADPSECVHTGEMAVKAERLTFDGFKNITRNPETTGSRWDTEHTEYTYVFGKGGWLVARGMNARRMSMLTDGELLPEHSFGEPLEAVREKCGRDIWEGHHATREGGVPPTKAETAILRSAPLRYDVSSQNDHQRNK